MLRKLIGISLIAVGLGLCYWGWRLENKDLEEGISDDDGPYAGRGGIIILVFGAIAIFAGLLLLLAS